MKTLPTNLRFATFPFRDGYKMASEKAKKSDNLIFPKNAMKLRFDKSFDATFSKVAQGLG